MVIGLLSGMVSVEVCDDNGCFGIVEIMIEELVVLSVILDGMNVICFGLVDGSIVVILIGGIVFYIYVWSDM